MTLVPYPAAAKEIVAYKDYMLGDDRHIYTVEDDARLLLWLAGQTWGNCVEIGCNEGMFTRALAEWYPGKRVYAVDSAYVTLAAEQECERVKRLCHFAKHLTNVTVVDADSRSFHYPKGVGFVFIDGDHSLEGVRADSEKALAYAETHNPVLIAWHDYRPEVEWLGVPKYLDELAKTHDLVLVDGTSIVLKGWAW